MTGQTGREPARLKVCSGPVEIQPVGASEHDVPVADELVSDPGLGYERQFEAGAPIYAPGDPPGGLFVVQSGEVDLLRPGAGDVGLCLLARIGRGEFFGETGVLLGAHRREHAVARLSTCVLEVDAGTFQAMCLERPEVAIRVIRSLAARVVALETRLEALGVDALVQPVARFLLARAQTDELPAIVPTTLREISQETGLSMQEAHGAVQALLERRLMHLVDEVPQIPDPEALAQL